MSTPAFEIRSLGDFRTWLKQHGADPGPWFGCIGPDHRSLLIARDEVYAGIANGAQAKFPLFPLTLPEQKPAAAVGDWWRETLAQVNTYFLRHMGLGLVAVVRLGAWEAVSDWCLNRPKEEWEPISYADFRRVAGQHESAMLYEHQFTGISVRPTK